MSLLCLLLNPQLRIADATTNRIDDDDDDDDDDDEGEGEGAYEKEINGGMMDENEQQQTNHHHHHPDRRSPGRRLMNRLLSVPTNHNNASKNQSQQPNDASSSSLSFRQILIQASQKGWNGGISGAMAGMIQVFSLMWIRTIMNYQCRYGTTFQYAFHTLYQNGGILRFYRGISFALIQAPLSKFVSTASNDSIQLLLSQLFYTKQWGPERTTIIASILVGLGRILLMRTFSMCFLFSFSVCFFNYIDDSVWMCHDILSIVMCVILITNN
jgi:Mitochondrial carrier protein